MTGRFKQLILILPLVIAGLVAVLGWWGNQRLRVVIEGELKTQLTATLKANVTALGIWSTNQTRLATALADDASVRAFATQIFKVAPPFRRDAPVPPELEQFVTEFKEIWWTLPAYN